MSSFTPFLLCGSCPGNGTGILWLESRQQDSNKIFTDPGDTRYSRLLPTTYQDIADRSAGTRWYNGTVQNIMYKHSYTLPKSILYHRNKFDI